MKANEIFFLSLIELTIMLIIFHGIIKEKEKSYKYAVFYIIAGSISASIISALIQNKTLAHLLTTSSSFILFLIYSNLITKLKIPSRTIVFFLMILFVGIIQFSGVIIYSLLGFNIEYIFIEGIVSQIIGLSLWLVMAKFIPISSLEVYIKEKNIYFNFTVINTFIIIYSISIFWYLSFDNLLNFFLEILIVIIITIFINIVFIKESLLNEEYKKKIEMYDTYTPIVKNLIDDIREKQHDYNNHINTIIALREKFASEKATSIDGYIKEASKEEIWEKLLSLNNEMIIGLLYSKYMLAEEKNINMEINISNYSLSSKYTDYELVEMYGILIDNAIEAAEKVKKDKKISIEIDRKNKINTVIVRNTAQPIEERDMKKLTKKGYTSKDKKIHGIGLNKLEKILRKDKGKIVFNYNSNSKIFTAKILHY